MATHDKNPKRVAAGKRNRLKRGPLTPAGREQLRRAILRHQPWRNSTGPTTPEGKAQSALNGKVRQTGPYSVREYKRNLAPYQKLLQDYDKAIADYCEAIRLDPKFVLAYNNRGLSWVIKKDHEKAIADFNEALRLDPKNVFARSSRGNGWYGKKEYEKAIADFNEALRLDPKNTYCYNSRAWLWATCSEAKYRDGKRAIESARKALELGKKDAGCMDTLAAAYAEAGEFEQAVRWQEQAMQDPQFRNDEGSRRRLELYRKKMPYRDE